MTPEDKDIELHISPLPDETQRHLLASEPDGIPLGYLKEYLRGLEPPVMVPQAFVAEIMANIERLLAVGVPLKEAKDTLLTVVERMSGSERDAVVEDGASRPTAPPGIGRFPDRLAAVVDSAGDSVRGFARKAGVSEGTLRSYMRGATTPDLDALARLAEAGEVNIAWLATGEGPKAAP